MRSELITPSCTNGTTGANGSIAASRSDVQRRRRPRQVDDQQLVGHPCALGDHPRCQRRRQVVKRQREDREVELPVGSVDRGGVHLTHSGPLVLAEVAGGDGCHRGRLDVGDGELGGGMPFEQLARTARRVPTRVRGSWDRARRPPRRGRCARTSPCCRRIRPSTPGRDITLRFVPSSTSSRSRYSGRSVCSSRSRHDASGPPRGMRSMSVIGEAM